jgi:hypothetical protein
VRREQLWGSEEAYTTGASVPKRFPPTTWQKEQKEGMQRSAGKDFQVNMTLRFKWTVQTCLLKHSNKITVKLLSAA